MNQDERQEAQLDDGVPQKGVEEEDWKDKYLRALAEIENSRKRLMREKFEAQGVAIKNVLLDVLQPFDQLETALNHADKAPIEAKSWAMGFQMILDQFRQVFSSYDIHSFSGIGKAFDPHMHEAVETEERGDIPEGQIIDEFQKGYRMGVKVIRPAKVKVATAPKEENEPIK